jgi:predicted KAP-like P-loop ATPase
MDTIDKTLFKEIEIQFKNHLEEEGNERLIFSGRFGMGKTTFLKHFFEDTKEYSVITIYPVNYSIKSNEDIFRYIKYDIFIEFLKRKVDLVNFDLGGSQIAGLYIKRNAKKIAADFMQLAGSLGKAVNSSFEILDLLVKFGIDFKKKAKEYYSDEKGKYDEADQAAKLLSEIENENGSLFEESILTRILDHGIAQLKQGGKKVILIIEDLDRIDPEHIFRILNVFSAHFDSRHPEQANRFGIDVVMIVCDEENIRTLFSYKYGTAADYNGYIDKFFSRSIFQFNIAHFLTDSTIPMCPNCQVIFGEK